MTEAEFWSKLEFRICAEFRAMEDRHLRYWWCDGCHPDEFRLDEPCPRIEGNAWIGSSPQADEWRFALHLDRAVPSRREIDWSALLPPDAAAGWLEIDVKSRVMRIHVPSRWTP